MEVHKFRYHLLQSLLPAWKPQLASTPKASMLGMSSHQSASDAEQATHPAVRTGQTLLTWQSNTGHLV
jgi:hypothetical protein